jgi:hypothetical protein
MSLRHRVQRLTALARRHGQSAHARLERMSDAELDTAIERHARILGLPVPTTAEQCRVQLCRLREQVQP